MPVYKLGFCGFKSKFITLSFRNRIYFQKEAHVKHRGNTDTLKTQMCKKRNTKLMHHKKRYPQYCPNNLVSLARELTAFFTS